MSAECKPPPGTPDGTAAIVRRAAIDTASGGDGGRLVDLIARLEKTYRRAVDDVNRATDRDIDRAARRCHATGEGMSDMTDTQRCEPPEHLRGVDGWHWVQEPVGDPHLAHWHAAERDDVEPLWTSTHHVYPGTPRYAVREWGWRYIAPVTPPADVAALVEALEEMGLAVRNCFKGGPPPDALVRLHEASAVARRPTHWQPLPTPPETAP